MSLEKTMMRKTILAAAALCPMLLHAQVNSPAQPQSAVQNAALVSKMTKPAAPGASSSAATPTKTPVHISSGVTFPKLIASTPVQESSVWLWRPEETAKTTVVSMIVTPDGTPTNLHVVRSLGKAIDEDVLESVSRYRFQPGTLDNSPIPIEVNLTVNILSRVQ
jgi:outer membrane biosynthesis protein TonB